MYGPLICYATKCTEGSSAEFWVALGISVVVVGTIVLVAAFLTKGK